MLWDDLLKEANGYLSSKDYTPSEQLREKYNLKYSDGKYYIKGYLQFPWSALRGKHGG